MRKKTISDLILEEMTKNPKGTIYTVSDFYSYGKTNAIKTALSRLTQNGKIHRIMDGFYTIPYYSELIMEYSYPSINEMAEKIAEKYSWNICPSGNMALNLVGLSTQVPNSYIFASDGPYREYTYMNKTIKFKHTSNKSISKFSRPLSLLIQSIKAIGENNITKEDICKMASYTNKFISDDFSSETIHLPLWIYEVLKQVQEVKLNE